MEKFEFMTAIKPVSQMFGAIDSEKLDLYFQQLQYVPISVLNAIVVRVMRTHEYKSFPVLAVFIEALHNEEARLRSSLPSENDRDGKCHKCGGTAWIEGSDRVEGNHVYSYVVSCDCCDEGKRRRGVLRRNGIHIYDLPAQPPAEF